MIQKTVSWTFKHSLHGCTPTLALPLPFPPLSWLSWTHDRVTLGYIFCTLTPTHQHSYGYAGGDWCRVRNNTVHPILKRTVKGTDD